MRKAQVTIKDLAKEIGVSVSTISKALRNNPEISQKKREEIQSLARKLNYTPNKTALSLKHKKTNTIGVIIPEIFHFFFSSVISGIEEVAHEKGYNVVVCQSNEKYDREVTNANVLFSNRVDGVLVSLTRETTEYDHLRNFTDNDVPLVFFDRCSEEIEADRVIVDDFQAAYKATEYLVKIGCKKIAHMTGPQSLNISKNRKLGYIQALKDNKLPIIDEMILEADTYDEGKNAIKQLNKEGLIPDGIFSINEISARGAVNALKKLGHSVPEDIKVTCFSGGWAYQMTDSPLIIIDQHGYEIGKEATTILIDRLDREDDNNKRTYIHKIIPSTLVI